MEQGQARDELRTLLLTYFKNGEADSAATRNLILDLITVKDRLRPGNPDTLPTEPAYGRLDTDRLPTQDRTLKRFMDIYPLHMSDDVVQELEFGTNVKYGSASEPHLFDVNKDFRSSFGTNNADSKQIVLWDQDNHKGKYIFAPLTLESLQQTVKNNAFNPLTVSLQEPPGIENLDPERVLGIDIVETGETTFGTNGADRIIMKPTKIRLVVAPVPKIVETTTIEEEESVDHTGTPANLTTAVESDPEPFPDIIPPTPASEPYPTIISPTQPPEQFPPIIGSSFTGKDEDVPAILSETATPLELHRTIDFSPNSEQLPELDAHQKLYSDLNEQLIAFSSQSPFHNWKVQLHGDLDRFSQQKLEKGGHSYCGTQSIP